MQKCGDLRVPFLGDVRKFLLKYAKNRYLKQWADKTHVLELEG